MNIKDYAMKLKYPDFHWVVSWCITKVCNLKCAYCHYPSSPNYRHPDFEPRIKKLLEIKPKHLCINGGEPLTIPNIVSILERLRCGIGEHLNLEFNTNATLRDRLIQILPFVNGICFSVDGVGEFNKIYRGFNGDILLENLKEAVKYKPRPEQHFYLVIVPVATEKTYKQLPELIKKVEQIWKHGNCPNVAIDIKVVYPRDHPLSISKKKEVWDDFINRSMEWHDQYEIPVTVRGLASASHLTPQGAKTSSQCIRQFFTAILDEDGHITYCKPERYFDYYKGRYDRGDSSEKIRSVLGAVNTLLINRYDCTCYFPCDHGEFIDDVLDCKRASDMAIMARERAIILSKEELRDACNFIRKHFHPDLIMDFQDITWQHGKPFRSREVARKEA